MAKRFICLAIIVLLVLLSLFSCKRDESADSVLTTSATEAIELAAGTNFSSEMTETTEPISGSDEAKNETSLSNEKTDSESEPVETIPTTDLRPTVEEPSETVHTHSWDIEVQEPTCTAVGYTTRTCVGCGETVRDSYTKVAGHSWGSWKTVKEATETSEGKAERTCSDCGKVESRILDKLPENHTHDYTSNVTVKATCAKVGVKTFVCDCGDKYTEDIPKAEHNYKKVTVDATCILRGYVEYTCRVCENSYRDNYTKVLPHDYKKTVTEPTCTEGGYTSYKCRDCGDNYIGDEVSPKGHSYKTTVTKPTCVADGYTTYECRECDNSYVDDKVAAKGHDYIETVTKNTCTTDGYTTHKCKTCGNTYTDSKTPATGHSWGAWKTTKEPTESATGIKERTCGNCGTNEKATLPTVEHIHSYTHAVTKPTCTTDGYTTHECYTCGDTYTDTIVSAKGHSWGSWATVKEATETSTGTAKRSCSACTASETKTLDKLPVSHTHNYTVTENVAATCTADGYVTKTCSCGDVITETVAAGHSWEYYHEDEVGHWDVYIICHCGWSCSAVGDYVSAFAAHVNSVDPETRYDHSYYDSGTWVVDVPAKDWYECTVCGAVK